MKAHYHDLKYVSVDAVVPNSWNPQEQNEETFHRLVQEVKDEEGEVVSSENFIAPITVLPMADGRFRILGGEHRWMAAKSAGIEEIPALILRGERWSDEDHQKFVTVRLNAIAGRVNPEKFLNLYNEMVQKYGREAMQGLMGYTDSKVFQKLVDGMKKGMRKQLSPELQAEFDARAKNAKTVEDLAKIIQDLFNRHGETLDIGFMIFTHGKQDHIYIPMDRKLALSMKKVGDYCRMTGTKMAEFMTPIVQEAVKVATKKLAEKAERDTLLEDEDPTASAS